VLANLERPLIRSEGQSIRVDVAVYIVAAGRCRRKRHFLVPMLLPISDIPSISHNIDVPVLVDDASILFQPCILLPLLLFLVIVIQSLLHRRRSLCIVAVESRGTHYVLSMSSAI
jgi:hypothetical protein